MTAPVEVFVPTEQDTTPASTLLTEPAAPAIAAAAAPAGPPAFDASEVAAELADSASSTVYVECAPVSVDERTSLLLDQGIDSVYDVVRQEWAFWHVPQDVVDSLKAAQASTAAPA